MTDYLQSAKQLISLHEGYRQYAYTDSTNNITVGYGRNLSITGRGISNTEAIYLLDQDILYFNSKLPGIVHNYGDMPDFAKVVLLDMLFNLGLRGLAEFNDFLEHMARHEWQCAAEAMLNSKWASQVKSRAITLSDILKTQGLGQYA